MEEFDLGEKWFGKRTLETCIVQNGVTTKRWWARLRDGSDYGTWKPTGCADLLEAQDYIRLHHGNQPVKEWLQL